MILHTQINTPLGTMRAAAADEGICLFDFEYRKSIDAIINRICNLSQKKWTDGRHSSIDLLEQQIGEYFLGSRLTFDLPLLLVGTPFQKSVWNGLMTIPYGETRTYKQQSIQLGNEKAIRAVASANGENGIAIIVPCHRVIGSNGSLTGYGGGLQRKKWLLDHENKYSGKSGQSALF